ncbi:MAG: hypothetical protein RLZZ511_3748 [Cyanobacteriota bacterium]|jgi:hypothetical protein
MSGAIGTGFGHDRAGFGTSAVYAVGQTLDLSLKVLPRESFEASIQGHFWTLD